MKNKTKIETGLLFLISSIVLLVSALSVSASGSIQTSLLYPMTADLCGQYPNNITIATSGITNKESVVLTNVNAMLIVPDGAPLSFVSSQTVGLGNIPALGSSSINPSWIIKCSSNNSGSYDLYVTYLSQNGYSGSSQDEAVSTVIVHSSEIGMNISIGSDENSETQQQVSVISDTTPTINISTSIDSICRGSLDEDMSFSDMNIIFNGAGKFHLYTFVSPLNDGYHAVYIKCNGTSGINHNSTRLEFVIDTVPPIISLSSPLGLVTQTYTSFSAGTNENSECRYSTTTQDYSIMNTFDRTGALIHSKSFDNLQTGQKKYYVKCRDEAGNIALSSFIIEVDLPVKAFIKLSDESPVKEGTINIEVTTSKNLRQAPILRYYFNDDPSKIITVPLSGSNSEWKGYLMIEYDVGNKIGTFIFSGIDINGNEGTEINSGNVFLVDTIKPVSPSTIEISNDGGRVRLEWYYEGEKQDYFNIYKSTRSGVNYIDYYDSSNFSQFLDSSVNEGTTYYYKVAAVDEAGNVGTLSQEISLTAYKGQTASSSSSTSQQSFERTDIPTIESLRELNRTIKDVDKTLIDIESALSVLKEKNEEKELINEFNLIGQVNSAKTDLDNLRIHLVGQRSFDSMNSEILSSIQDANTKLKRIKTETPKNIRIIEQSSEIQSVPGNLEREADELLSNYDISEAKKKEYLARIEKINKDVKVSQNIYKILLTSLNEQETIKIVVEKQVSYETPDVLENIIIFENIPKAVAESAYEIEFKTQDYTIVKEDPLIRWDIAQLSYEKIQIKYIFNKDSNLNNVKSSRTVVLEDPSPYEQSSQNSITGFSISGVFSGISQKINGFELFSIILGTIIIAGLLFYYLVYVRSDNDKKTKDENKYGPDYENEKNKSSENRFADLTPDKYFYMKNGFVLKSIEDLSEALKIIEPPDFSSHVSDGRNDFAVWVNDVLCEKNLAMQLMGSKTKDSSILILDSFLFSKGDKENLSTKKRR